jgi:hypothetical protein
MRDWLDGERDQAEVAGEAIPRIFSGAADFGAGVDRSLGLGWGKGGG